MFRYSFIILTLFLSYFFVVVFVPATQSGHDADEEPSSEVELSLLKLVAQP
jgi:hypothetical protein